MKVRVEFASSKSSQLPWVLRLVRKFPTYKKVVEDGLEIHSVELEGKTLESFQAIHHLIWNWKSTTYWVDDILVTGQGASQRVWQYLSPPKEKSGKGFACLTTSQAMQALTQKLRIPEG
jgi:hypothetical protein